MSWFYRTLVRPALFAQDSEEIHNRTLATLGWMSRNESLCDALAAFYSAPALPVEVFGLNFPNPVGLAAGMDKHATAAPVWPALGFGFSELGGVTWHAQPGNPAPRMFRAVQDEALINRMGFNNPGAEALARKLADWRALGRWPNHPVGVNLGKSKITPLETAADDYAGSFRLLWPHADFFVVNVSSPNTPNLRQLQDKGALDEILAALQEVNRAPSAERDGKASTADPSRLAPRASGFAPKPILVKVAPDLSFEALDEILELVGPRGIAGVVATNTTIARPQSADPRLRQIYAETGGLSGKPLRSRSTEVIRHLSRQTKGHLPIIGVGGIFDADDAWEKITAGATLVQVYTGLVYEGPAVVGAIVRGLQERLCERGLRNLSQAVGTAV
jgi:dihydroorotate dehydrogenase